MSYGIIKLSILFCILKFLNRFALLVPVIKAFDLSYISDIIWWQVLEKTKERQSFNHSIKLGTPVGATGVLHGNLQDDSAQEKVHFNHGAWSFIFLFFARIIRFLIEWHCSYVSLWETATVRYIGFLLSTSFQQGGQQHGWKCPACENPSPMEIKPNANSTQNVPGTGLKPWFFPLRSDSSQHAPQTLHSSYSLSAFACFDVLFSNICQDRFLIFLTASYQRESKPVNSINCAERLNVREAAAWTWLHIVFNIWHQTEDEEGRRKKTDWFNQ